MDTSSKYSIYSKSGGKRRRYKRTKARRTMKKNAKSGKLIAYGKIYADWCGHCVALKPEWAKLEQMMLPLRSNNIESAQKDSLVDAFNRKYKTNLSKEVGFPTIFKLSNHGGKVEIYNGERTASAMIVWLKMKPAPQISSSSKKGLFNWF